MRAFSTNSQHCILSQNGTEKSASKEQDLEGDEMAYLIEQRHQESLKTKAGNRWSVKHAVHLELGAHPPRKEQVGDGSQLLLNGQLKEPKTSKLRNTVLQDKHKTRLLRELMPNKAPLVDVPRTRLHATEDITVKHLATRLTELEERLATAKAFDWDAEYRNAQKGQSLQEITDDARSLSKSAKKQFIAKAKQRFATAIAEIKANKRKHEATVVKLQESITALRLSISHQNTGTVGQGGGEEVLKAKTELIGEQDKIKTNKVSREDEKWLRQEQNKNLEELKRKKEILLRKKDELALKMAQLNSQTQETVSIRKNKPDFDVKEQPAASFETASTTSMGKNKNQDFSALTNRPSYETRRSSSLQTESLRLYLPGGILTIDNNLTVDINASTVSLRSQISALQDRLSSFYPRLDDLPSSVGQQTDKYILKTWLKILISRWQAKTGDYGTAVDDQLKRVMGQTVRDNGLSKEAAERMAKRWNDAFSDRRNYTVTAEDIQHVQNKAVLDDYDEMGFLQDEYKPEEELAAIQEVSIAGSQPSFPQPHALQPPNPSPVLYREEDEVGLSDEEFRAFISAFADYGVTKPKLDVEKFKMNESLQAKEVGEVGQLSFQDVKKQDIDVLSANLRAKELDCGDHADTKTETSKTANGTPQEVPIRTVPTDHSRRSFAYLSTPNLPTSKQPTLLRTRASSGMAELEAANIASKKFGRSYSTSPRTPLDPDLAPEREIEQSAPQQLPHLTSSGSAHMVSISAKAHTTRTAIAVGTVYFSNPTPLSLITSNSLKKGDVLSVSRIAGIMAAKKCPEIVPLCHPIPLTHVSVELRTFPSASASIPSADNMSYGGVQIECKVACTGATGVEMEALTAVMGTALSVVDMCKAVDKFQRIGDVRVVLKEGGKSGVWKEESWTSWQEE